MVGPPEAAPDVDVILPVLDEAGAIPWVLGRMPEGYRPIVVDNGSEDGSGELAESLGAMVVQEPARGFGAACAAGLDASSAPIVCFMDCDRSLDPRELPAVVHPSRAELQIWSWGRDERLQAHGRFTPGSLIAFWLSS